MTAHAIQNRLTNIAAQSLDSIMIYEKSKDRILLHNCFKPWDNVSLIEVIYDLKGTIHLRHCMNNENWFIVKQEFLYEFCARYLFNIQIAMVVIMNSKLKETAKDQLAVEKQANSRGRYY